MRAQLHRMTRSALRAHRRDGHAGIRVHPTSGRAAAGAVAGGVGGLLFGALMFTSFSVLATGVTSVGLLPRVAQVLEPVPGPVWTTTLLVWTVHMVMSLLFGVVFSAFVAPHSYRWSILWGLVYSVLLWLGGVVLALPLLLGEPVMLTAEALYSLVGHLMFGVGLGATYVGFHDLEVREGTDGTVGEKHAAWARRERDA